jgi:hypothetical protein
MPRRRCYLVVIRFALRPTMPLLSRRSILGAAALPWLAACATPLPITPRPAGSSAAAARLLESAEAHGLAAYRALTDINVAYDGRWRPFIDRIQPVVVDKGYRGRSEERLQPSARVVAQSYAGPLGIKHVWWRRGAGADLGEVGVWFNGARSADADHQAASALVAEGYGLFLLGPLWLAEQGLAMELDGTERVDGRLCDVVQVWKTPGLGRVALDRVAVCVDRSDSLTRRLRFTLEGFSNTRGAVAEVDTFDHERRFGVMWPMRSYERVVSPIPIPAHDWHITGLDVNRGYGTEALQGPSFTGAAAAPAAPVGG